MIDVPLLGFVLCVIFGILGCINKKLKALGILGALGVMVLSFTLFSGWLFIIMLFTGLILLSGSVS